MPRPANEKTVQDRVRTLMADGEARTTRRIAYLVGANVGTVGGLLRSGLLVKVGEEPTVHPWQRTGAPIVALAEFAEKFGVRPKKRAPRVSAEVAA